MPATQDAYARAFAANARRPGAPAMPAAPSMPPLPQPSGVSTQQPVVTSPVQNMQGAGALPTTPMANSPWAAAKAAVGQPAPAGSPGISMGGQPFSPGIAAVVQAMMRQGGGGGMVSPQQNMQGPNAQPNMGNMGLDIFGLKAKQAAAQAAMQPPAPPPAAAPVAPPQPPADWARQFFGSARGGQYGNGVGLAQIAGWGQKNPQGVQRWADAGHVPQPTMMPQTRRPGGSGR